MSRELLLGIDIGTSACKVAVFTPEGEVLAQRSESYRVFYPKPGWAEQNPEDWWSGVCRSIKTMITQDNIDPARIAAVGIDGQSWSAIPIDKAGRVLHNTPIWMDTRAQDICDQLEKTVGNQRLFEVSGNPNTPSYTLPKILWFKKHLPEVYKKIDKVLQSNSYIVYRLTGEITQDLSQGYGLHCFNMRSGSWDFELCDQLGIKRSLLPELYPCHQVVGGISKKGAEESGLLEDTPVVAGGLDAACGTLGAGVISSGQTQEQGGQAGGMSICTDEYHADPQLILSHHVVPGHWLLQGGTVGGGGVVNWLEKELGAQERASAGKNKTSSLYELDKLAEGVAPGSDGLIFLPYMAGERSPIWNPHAKGVYFGLDFTKTRGHIYRSGMEGVAYSLRHNLEVAEAAGAQVGVLSAMGGAANSRLWTQLKADITGKQIDVASSDMATALGAVILAGVGVGIYKDFKEAVDKTVKVSRTHRPNPDNSGIYNRGYSTYTRLYENLKTLMQGEII